MVTVLFVSDPDQVLQQFFELTCRLLSDNFSSDFLKFMLDIDNTTYSCLSYAPLYSQYRVEMLKCLRDTNNVLVSRPINGRHNSLCVSASVFQNRAAWFPEIPKELLEQLKSLIVTAEAIDRFTLKFIKNLNIITLITVSKNGMPEAFSFSLAKSED